MMLISEKSWHDYLTIEIILAVIFMNIITRIKNICLSPKTEWPVIATETLGTRTILLRYVLPLAAFAAVVGFIANSVIGQSLPLLGTYRVPLMAGIATAIFVLVMSLVGTFIMTLAINGLAPKFDGEQNAEQAFKVAAYSYTPVWIANVFQLLPMLGFLSVLAGFYGFYLLYLGLPLLMKTSPNRSLGYTVLVIITAIVLSVLINLSMSLVSSSHLFGEQLSSPIASEVEFDRDSPMGKLQDLGKKMESLQQTMPTATKSDNPEQQMAAAIESMGALLGGGKKVVTLDTAQLKAMLPKEFAGVPQKSQQAEKNGALGVSISKVEATYAATGKKISLSITDMGGVSGLLGLASWINVEGEKEDENGYEKTYQADGRMLHEKSTRQGDSEFSLVVAERFLVSAKATGIAIKVLQEAVMALPLQQLEALAAG